MASWTLEVLPFCPFQFPTSQASHWWKASVQAAKLSDSQPITALPLLQPYRVPVFIASTQSACISWLPNPKCHTPVFQTFLLGIAALYDYFLMAALCVPASPCSQRLWIHFGVVPQGPTSG